MIKQTKGAIKFLTANYRAVLKHAFFASLSSGIALSNVANADDYYDSWTVNLNSTYDNSRIHNDYNVKNGGAVSITNTDNVNIVLREISNRGGENNTLGNINLSLNTALTEQKLMGLVVQGGSFNGESADIKMIVPNDDGHSDFENFGRLVVDENASFAKFNNLTIDGGANRIDSKTDNFRVTSTFKLYNDASGSLKQTYTDKLIVGDKTNGGAQLYIGNLFANKIVVDPEWTSNSSILAVNNFNNTNITTGEILIAKNSALVYGADSLESAKANIASAGGLSQTGTTAMLYLNKPLMIGLNQGVVVDGTSDGIASAEQNTLTLGENSALVLSKTVTDNATYQDGVTPTAALSFSGLGTVKYTNTSKVLLDTPSVRVGARIKVFNNVSSVENVAGASGDNLTVQSVNGNFKTYIENNAMSGDTNEITQVGGTSSGETGEIEQTFTQQNFNNMSNEMYQLMQGAITDVNSVGEGANFLASVAGETFTGGKEAEQVARLGQLGGTYQANLAVSDLVDNTIAARTGIGNTHGSKIYAEKKKGLELWVAPSVQLSDSRDLKSANNKYGSKVRIADMAFGLDANFENGFASGVMAHFGNGTAKGKQLGSGVKGDVKFIGIGAFATYKFGNFDVVGNINFDHVENDIKTNLGLVSYNNATATTKNNMFKVGALVQYTYDFTNLTVKPHAGLRYTTIMTDDYTLKSNGRSVAKTSTDDLSVVSIPLGVTLEKSFNVNDWTIKPAVDLGFNFNVGDTETQYKTTFSGLNPTSLKADIADSVTYNVGLGVKLAKGEHVNIDLGTTYVGSKNTNNVNFNLAGSYLF